ncbi:MAG: hypothetical protein GY725_13595 [bacterium]|nr:hypothetical protein [bacterium]
MRLLAALSFAAPGDRRSQSRAGPDLHLRGGVDFRRQSRRPDLYHTDHIWFFVAHRIGQGSPKSTEVWLGMGFLVILGLLAFFTRGIWQEKLVYSEVLANSLLNPLLNGAALWVAGGDPLRSSYLPDRAAAVPRKPLPRRPRRVDHRRAGVTWPFLYAPLRYYIPFLPAYLLLILEWLDLRRWRRSMPRHLSWAARLGCPLILIWGIFSLAQGFNLQVLQKHGIIVGNGPGLSDSFMVHCAAPFAAVVGLGLWLFRGALFPGKRVGACRAVVLLFSAMLDVYEVGRFLAAPSYRSREISAELRRIVPRQAGVAGEWAPFFALGTDLRVLYMNTWINDPSRLAKLRPDYFLDCDTELIERFEGVELKPPVFASSYAGRKVRLHPLEYEEKRRPEGGLDEASESRSRPSSSRAPADAVSSSAP